MFPIYHDPACGEYERRSLLYDGALVLLSPNRATSKLCAFARELLHDGFAGVDPETAQHEMPATAFAPLIADVKARFVGDPRAKEFVRDVLSSVGCDLDRTYIDVPHLRVSKSEDCLTTGVGYAWRCHRDTWYSAPLAQLNFWLPVFAVEPANALAFHLEYFDQPISNSSASYDHDLWNQSIRHAFDAARAREAAGGEAAGSSGLPKLVGQLEMTHAIVPVPRVDGVINFSGQHLHSTVVNHSGRTRYSIDFRTVNVDDALAGRNAPNVDCACTGSAFGDFTRASDFTAMSYELVELFSHATETTGEPSR